MSSTADEKDEEDLKEGPINDASAQNEEMNRAQKSVSSGGGMKGKADEDQFLLDPQFMKTFVAQASRRDEHSVFGELVANRLRKCGKSHHEIVTAQHKIEGILFDLEMGAYDKYQQQQHQHHMWPQKNCQNSPTVTNSEVVPSQTIQNTSPLQTITTCIPSPQTESSARDNKCFLTVNDIIKSECKEEFETEDVIDY